ncbi:hypothetical protein [Nocardia asiatica]|uniref:hypothetical protein n=1 Tax=Nocardia asiatica TaxID=209252 RepID=UPI00245408F2|nr:hypothetical protein [Nocardia asiatica]
MSSSTVGAAGIVADAAAPVVVRVDRVESLVSWGPPGGGGGGGPQGPARGGGGGGGGWGWGGCGGGPAPPAGPEAQGGHHGQAGGCEASGSAKLQLFVLCARIVPTVRGRAMAGAAIEWRSY